MEINWKRNAKEERMRGRESSHWINVFQMGLEMRGGGVSVGNAWLHSVAHINLFSLPLTHTDAHTHSDTAPALIAALVCLTTQNFVCIVRDSQ